MIRAYHAITNGTFGSPQEIIPPTDSPNGDHPRKRRRVSSPDRTSMEHLIASPQNSETRPTLRIELLKIVHRDSKKIRPKHNAAGVEPYAITHASCRITITDVSDGRRKVLHCESQNCQLITFKSPVGPHRVSRIHLPRAFFVPKDSLLVTRIDDSTRALSDSYRVLVEFESADGANWPPLDTYELGIDGKSSESPTRRHWSLESQFDEIYGSLKAPVLLRDSFLAHEPTSRTDYEIDADLQWTSGYQALKRLEAGSKPCITALDPGHRDRTATNQINGHLDVVDERLVNGVNGTNGINGTHDDHDRLLSPEPGDDEMNGEELTPSRSLRTRGGDKNYNLKALSDQAHGKKRRQRRQQAAAAAGLGSGPYFELEGRVKYLLPPDQPLCVPGFRCLACGVSHSSLQLLQLHLGTHLDHEFVLQTTSQGPQFHVTARSPSTTSPSKTFQLGPPTTEFNLDAFLGADQTWLQSRLGSESTKDDFVGDMGGVAPRAAPTPAPAPAPGFPVAASLKVPRAGKQTGPRSKTVPFAVKTYIPESNYKFFHPVSKQELKAGDEVPFVPAEKTWFYHKHRESLNESQNLTAAELEYIKEFDGAMQSHDISARAYFPRAWLDFVRTRSSWLIGAKHRMIEFSLHESYLLASKLLLDEHLEEAMGFIEDARKEKKRLELAQPRSGDEQSCYPGRSLQGSPRPTPKTPPIRKSAKGCGICKMPVLSGPELLMCSNAVRRLLFHHISLRKPD